MNFFRKTILFATSAIAFAINPTYAQTPPSYPDKPIKIVVPYAPGGFTDILARLLSQKISEQLKQPVIVENKPGASTIIGAESVARARPDGYTLLMAVTTTLSSNPHLFSKLPYKADDFKPVALAGLTPFVLVANPSMPANDLQTLTSYAKANPGKLTAATLGNGSSTHLVLSMFRSVSNSEMVDVPYKGASLAMSDLIAGHVDLYFDAPSTSLPHINAGRVKAIALTSEQRLENATDIPTFQESGAPEMRAYSWYGLLAPAGTPDSIIETLNQAVNNALSSPEVVERFKAEGAETRIMNALAFGELIEEHSKTWGDIINELNIKLD